MDQTSDAKICGGNYVGDQENCHRQVPNPLPLFLKAEDTMFRRIFPYFLVQLLVGAPQHTFHLLSFVLANVCESLIDHLMSFLPAMADQPKMSLHLWRALLVPAQALILRA